MIRLKPIIKPKQDKTRKAKICSNPPEPVNVYIEFASATTIVASSMRERERERGERLDCVLRRHRTAKVTQPSQIALSSPKLCEFNACTQQLAWMLL